MKMDDDVREAWAAIQEETGEEQEETLAQNGGQEMDEDVREAWEAIGGADKGINGDKAVKGDVATADNGVKAVNGAKGEARPGEEEGKPLSEGDWEEIQSGVLPPSNEIVKVDDPGFLDGLKHAWDGVKGIWEDPTGEDGPLWYLTKNIATGIGAATGKVVGGMAKGFVDLAGMGAAGVARAGETAFNMLTNSNWHGVSDAIAAGTQGIDKWIDILWADPFILRGMYDGIEGAKEATGAINSVAEMAAGLGGIGAAGKLAKGAAMMKKGMEAARAAKIAHRATAAGFGLGGYERMAADEGGVAADGEGGFWTGGNWLQEFTAMAGGIAEGAIFGAFGPLKKSFEGLPQLAEQTKMQAFRTFVQEMGKAGAAMGGAEATKQALMGYAGAASGTPWMVDSGKTEKLEDGREVPILTPQTLETAAKSTMSQFLVGSGFHLAGAVNGKIGEAARYRIQENRKAYCPIMDRQARTAAALAADGRTVLSGGRGCEYVDEMLADGAVKFKDGSVWRPGRAYELRMPGGETVVKAGRATITVSDGTILDAETGTLAGYAPSGTTWRSVAAAEYAKLAANRRNDLSDAEARARMWELGGNDAGWYLAKPKDVELAEENSWNRDAYGELSEEGRAWLGITQMSRTPELAEAARAGMADVVGGRRTLVEVHRDLLAAMEAQAKTMDAVRIAPEGMTEASNRPEGKLRNAGMLLESLERGELPVDKECEVKGLDATGTYQEKHELEGEWDQAKAEPIIVWIGKDGSRRCVAGKSRLEAARKAGAKTIDAVYVREEDGWDFGDALRLDAVQNLREGKGTAEQIFKGIDALGVRNREDLERYGIMHAEMPAVLDALDFANLATEPVKEAVRKGTLDAEKAGMIVKTLGVGRTGRNAERLQRIAVEKIAGKMSAEEAAGAMEELASRAAERGKIDLGDAKAVDDAIMAGRVKAVGEVRVASDAVAMETEDGKITTVGEELAGKENGERGTGNGERVKGNGERVIDSNEQRYGGTELDVNGGSVGCARFPNAKVTCETAHEPTVEGGVREVRTVVVEGLKAQEMLAPENRADAIDFMGRVAEAAGEMGFRFRDPEANAAAELLLRGEAAKARAAEMGAAEKGLVDAGQRLVDGLFGKESGIKVREGTAEEAAEVLGEARGKERFSIEIVDGKETAVANGYPLPIRDARNPEKVLQILSRLVGRSAAQIGEVKLSRIAYKTIDHLVNSEHARSDRTENGREAKKLWRGTVAGMSVVDDMVTTSQLGTAEDAHHLNKDWKNTAKFYRAETRFAVETESGKYEVYPCELVVAEMRNGERIVYDITEIGTPTRSAAASQKGSTVGVPQRGSTAHGGVGATPNSISQSGGGTQEGKMPLRDEAGQVKGWFDRGTGEVVLMKGADIRTVAHEIGWHAVRQWAEKNSPELLSKMNEYAASCPKSLRNLIEKNYKGFTGEALIDEIGAGRFERELGDEFRKLLETRPQVRSWWQKVTDAIRKMLRGFIGKGDGIDLKKMKKMSPEEAMKWLAGQMLEGKGLAEPNTASGNGRRASIGGIFTGTAADYANRSREGGKDDGPSLQKIGTGEGSQVYGWGLYGSSERGVAENYARSAARDKRINQDENTFQAVKKVLGNKTSEDALQVVYEAITGYNDWKEVKEWLKRNAEYDEEVGPLALAAFRRNESALKKVHDEFAAKENLYEQTFFTDREPGDESHLLKWYEPVSETLQSRLLEAAVEEGKAQKSGKYFFFGANKMFEKGTKQTGEELYLMFRDMLGSPMAASEWLAAHDIDGVKYPVDSYGGKGVKDGDKAGWNYVSFRDDNIRVDHKWTDGQIRYSLAITPEVRKDTTVDAAKATLEKTRKALAALAGRRLVNDETKIEAQVNARQARKIVSNKAVAKSEANGFTRAEHNAAAEIIETLWKHATLGKTEPDRNNDPSLKSVKRFVSPVFFSSGDAAKEACAHLTVKESVEHGHRIYSIEIEKLEALGNGADRSRPPLPNAPNADSIAQTGGEAQGGKRLSIGTETERREGAEKALKGLLKGRRRVIEPVNPGAAERGEAGSAAGIEYEADVQVPEMSPSEDPSVAQPVAMGVSELSRMYRAITGHMFKVKGKGSAWNNARHGTWKNGKAWLAADVFGIVDKSDLEAIKEDLRKEGKFRHEDPQWAATHTKKQIEEMRDVSEMMLEDRITTLADDRVHGKRPGGNRSAINAMAHEIGRLVCEMPVDAGAPQRLKDMHTLGKGIVEALAKDPELRKEAEAAARWWRGEREQENGERGTEKKGEKELFAEMYGMFLGAPEAMRQRAPQAFAKIRELLSGNETLWKAYRGILEARASEGGQAARVMDEIRKQWDEKAQKELHELEKELERPLGSWWTRAKATFLLDFHSTEAPAMLYIDKAVKEKLKEARSNLKKGIIGKGEYEAILRDVKREKDDFKLATLTKQRGGGEGRLYGLEFVSQVLGDATRDGVKLDDLRTYMKCKRTIELQGRADSAGFTGREAVQVLEKMKADMGEAQYQRIEAAANRFRALREKHVLDNPLIAEAFGQKMIDYWRVNASYVRSERILSAEEVATYKRMREEWLKEHPGETNVLADIEAMMDMHMAHSGGSHGETFMKRLEGSQKMTEDPLRATLENDLRIQEFARRNHYAVQLARAAKELGLDGFAVTKDLRGSLKGSKRYGTVSFLEKGERKVLVMPKVVAEEFAAAAKDMNLLIRANRWISGILTQYSPRFALRNIVRNRESNNNNIAWMREGAVVTAAGVAGMRPVARWANFLMEQAAAHLPDKVARNALMNVLYGEKTNMYWVAQATRMAKLMTDPAKLRKRSEEADRLATAGKFTEAQQILDEIKQIKKFMKMPIFAGMREMVEGKAGKSNLDELLGTLGFETNADGTELKGLKRLGAKMKRFNESVRRYNTFEEARVKIIALLAAERANMRAAAEGREMRRAKEIAYTVATMSGSPRYENRGRAMNYLEVACGPFMNVGMKGAARTIESMRSDPGAWWSKAAGRIAGRLSTCVLWMGGGYKVLSNAWRAANGDDEEANRAAEALDRFGKRMSHALANCSDYRLRNYDIVPVGLFGKWSTFGISMPRGDEDRLLMPAVDLLAKSLVDSKTAERCGFSKYTDMGYGAGDALYATLPGSGLVPDMGRSGIIWNVFRDAAYAWFQNPYNSFTQRTVYSQQDWDARFIDPWNFAKKVGKQVWRDVGGETVLPASSWDEDEGQWEDQGTWAMGFSDPEDAGAMPVGGKTIFQALHSIPWLSAAASGMLFMANDGNKRIARRIDKLRQAEMKAERYVINKIANEVVRGLAAKGAEWDYSDYVSEQLEKYRLPEDTDKEIIEDRVFDKVQKVIDGEELQTDPIGKAIGKMGEDRRFEQIMKHLESIGWKEDE